MEYGEEDYENRDVAPIIEIFAFPLLVFVSLEHWF